MTPHEGPSERLPDPAPGCEPPPPTSRDRSHRPGLAPGMGVPIYSFLVARGCRRVERLEDSPSGLWRTLGKRVGCKPSGVRIPHPPPPIRDRQVPDFLCLIYSRFSRSALLPRPSPAPGPLSPGPAHSQPRFFSTPPPHTKPAAAYRAAPCDVGNKKSRHALHDGN